MNIHNDTNGAKHIAVPMKDKTGREHLVVIVTYAFIVDPYGKVELDRDTAPPPLVDTYHGADAANSSIRRPSQLFDVKPGTDVILVGHAHPPARGEATHVDVTLTFGPIHKCVRAHGLRVWQAAAFGGLKPGPACPIREPIPLVYELAWGGLDRSDPEQPFGEPRNTVGRGAVRDWRSLIGQPAAQIENPAKPLRGHDPEPWGFGVLHRHWSPRASFAGTFDETWAQTKMPLLPDDFDPRFHVTVPADQWTSVPLRGDEPAEIVGAVPHGVWRFRLPRKNPRFASLAHGQRTEHPTHLDTIYIDADAGRVELYFRAKVPIPRKYEMLESVWITEKRLMERPTAGGPP